MIELADLDERRRYLALLRERQRRQARRGLIAYVEATTPQYRTAWHHRRIAARLEAVERGETDRLMIICPPRHGKSLLCSRRLPAWYLGRNPTRDVLAASYGGDLSITFGRDLRNTMAGDDHQAIFLESRMAADSAAANRWHTDAGGGYLAAGVGGPITGHGGHLILLDDPVKSRAEADSEHMRELTWDWYRNDLYTRLQKGGAIVLIQTRWHEDDLAGRLLREMEAGGDQWEILHLPAIDDQGRALWPEMFDLDALRRRRTVIGERAWQALYQGDPRPREGGFFDVERIGEIDWGELPTTLRTVLTLDTATTPGDGDYTVICAWAFLPDGRIWLLDMWREQASAHVWIKAMLGLALKWNVEAVATEKDMIIRSVWPVIEERQRKLNIHFRPVLLTIGRRTKPERAAAIQARIDDGTVSIPRDLPHRSALLDELAGFPTAVHDDIVDAWSVCGRLHADIWQSPEEDEFEREPTDILFHPPTVGDAIKSIPRTEW